MNYYPSIEDLDQSNIKSSDDEYSYSPSVEDIDPSLIKQAGKAPFDIQSEMKKFGMNPIPRNAQEMEQYKKHASEQSAGMRQGAINSLIGMANLLPKVNIPKQNFVADNEYGKSGEVLGELGTYFVPGGIASSFTKAAGAIPKIGHQINALVKGIKESKKLNPIAKNIGAGSEGAIFSAANEPSEDKENAALTGYGFGAGTNIASQMLSTQNPFVKSLGRMLAGGGVGYMADGKEGAEYGAGAGFLAPSILNKIGIGKIKPGTEGISHLNQAEVKPVLEAANRLGTPITPAEASGNPYVGGIEGKYGRVGEAAAERTNIETKRILSQKNAITSLIDNIHDFSPSSQNAITNMYRSAYQWNIKPTVINQLKQDPIINQAFETVKNDPAYQRKLNGIPENNIAYLDKVKRSISDKEGSYLNQGEEQKAREYTNARNDLTDLMDSISPDYKQARALSQNKIIAKQLKKGLGQKEVTGTNFFNKYLRNDNQFNELFNSLHNAPEAQANLKDMKLAWRNLINVGTARAASGKAETSMSGARESFTKLIDIWDEMTGNKTGVEALRFIHSPEWEHEFKNISLMKDQKERDKRMIDLMGRAASYGAIKEK